MLRRILMLMLLNAVLFECATLKAQAVNCNEVIVQPYDTAGCHIRLVEPANCETIDLTSGKTYTFGWTTDGSWCETPYTLLIAGNPATGLNSHSWSFSLNESQGITNFGGIINVSANALKSFLTSTDGMYHWVVQGYSGSHPASQTFIAVTDGFNVSGRITNSLGTGLSGVTVTRSGGGQPASAVMTNATGDFIFLGVPANALPYTITPSNVGMTFIPVSRNLTVVASPVGNIDFTSATQQYQLGVTTSGNGIGTVTSTPAGISCGPVCTANFNNGTPVTLTATTSVDYAFTGWSGNCSRIASCPLTMINNLAVIASFGTNPKARILSTGYASLNDACNASGLDSTILALTGDHAIGSLTLNQGSNIIIKGGYTTAFNTPSAAPTNLIGTLVVNSGSLRVDGVKIRP